MRPCFASSRVRAVVVVIGDEVAVGKEVAEGDSGGSESRAAIRACCVELVPMSFRVCLPGVPLSWFVRSSAGRNQEMC
jgi:hypothetical protein